VRVYIDKNCAGQIEKLSFVCFSLGGLIARASFPLLMSFKDKFHTFLTLGSPHLGYMYNSSKLLDTGLWFLQQFKKSVCLSQLGMTDNSDPSQCCVYLMSEWPGLDWFEHIVLVSSN
jgi:hypothetical protein